MISQMRRRDKTGDACDVHGRFRLPGANKHATLLRAQRKHVTRSCQVLRLRARIDGRQNRRRAIRGRDSRGHAPASFD